jgi:hypothetical protein
MSDPVSSHSVSVGTQGRQGQTNSTGHIDESCGNTTSERSNQIEQRTNSRVQRDRLVNRSPIARAGITASMRRRNRRREEKHARQTMGIGDEVPFEPDVSQPVTTVFYPLVQQSAPSTHTDTNPFSVLADPECVICYESGDMLTGWCHPIHPECLERSLDMPRLERSSTSVRCPCCMCRQTIPESMRQIPITRSRPNLHLDDIIMGFPFIELFGSIVIDSLFDYYGIDDNLYGSWYSFDIWEIRCRLLVTWARRLPRLYLPLPSGFLEQHHQIRTSYYDAREIMQQTPSVRVLSFHDLTPPRQLQPIIYTPLHFNSISHSTYSILERLGSVTVVSTHDTLFYPNPALYRAYHISADDLQRRVDLMDHDSWSPSISFRLLSQLGPVNDIRVVSDLNGNNGSYTNTDDHARRANLNNRGNGGNRKGHHEPLPCGPPPPAIPEPEVPTRVYCVDSISGEAINPKGHLCKLTNVGYVSVEDGVIYEYFPPHVVVADVVESKPGYVVVQQGRGGHAMTLPLSLEYLIPDGKYGPKYIKGSKGYYYVDTYSSLEREMPHTVLTPSIEAQVIAKTQRLCVTRQAIGVSGTIEYFLFRHFLQHIAGVFSPIGFLGIGYEHDYASTTITLNHFDHGDFWVVPATECTIPIDWIERTDYAIAQHGGGVPPPRRERENVPRPILYWFDDMQRWLGDDGQPKSKWNTLHMFDLHGERKFVVYDNIPVNFLKATKRLIGERAGEQNLVKHDQSAYQTMMQFIIQHTAYFRYHQYMKDLEHHGFNDYDNIDDIHIAANYQHYQQLHTILFMLLGRVCFTTLQSYVDSLKDKTNWAYYTIYEQYLTIFAPIISRTSAAAIPHVKRSLRAKFVQNTLLHDDSNIMVVRLEAKIKREWAKPGKVPRLFVAYESGCMYANELPEFAKICLDGFHHFLCNGVAITILAYTKPKMHILTKVMNEYVHYVSTRDSVFFMFFSDDSLVVGNVGGFPFAYNIDISSCDAGNRNFVFGVTYLVLSHFHQDRALGLIAQCMAPIRCRNPKNRQQYFDLDFNIFLGSGSTITSLVDHIASFVAAISSAICLAHLNLIAGTAIDQIEEALRDGFSKIGHLITLEPFLTPSGFVVEKAQFLKHSPFMTESAMFIPTLNYGCVFRSLGKVDDCICKEKLGVTTAQFRAMSNSEKCDLFVSGVVAGLCNEPQSIIMDALRARFNRKDAKKITPSSQLMHELDFVDTDRSMYVVATESICRRYDCSEHELGDLVEAIMTVRAGYEIFVPVLTKIFNVDYGL